jgi:murein DD-endopeptidase MepM/ murein hydrolase activator NlpD
LTAILRLRISRVPFIRLIRYPLPKNFRKSRIEVDDAFLARVVPAILQNSPELKVADPSNLLDSWLTINGELRRRNSETIASFAAQTAPEILWRGPFKQLINTAVEAGFAAQRTYVYKGQEVDHQVHLAFDLASTIAAPAHAANRGRVVHAGWLGIYGNCEILDHGTGLQSLYAHLSQIEVNPATWSRRIRSSAAAARRGSRAATTCTSRCCSAAMRSRRSSGGARSGFRTATEAGATPESLAVR